MEKEEQAFTLQKMGPQHSRNSLPLSPQVLSHLITPPALPSTSCLVICVPSCSILVWTSQRVMCMNLCMHMSIMTTYACLWMPTQKRVQKLFCFHPCDRGDRIPSAKHTAAPPSDSPLSSASTALRYSSFHAFPNGFSNAGTRFLSRLDRHFPLCLEMGIRHSVVRSKDSAYRVETFPQNLFEKAKCETHIFIWPNKGNKSNSEIAFSLFCKCSFCLFLGDSLVLNRRHACPTLLEDYC